MAIYTLTAAQLKGRGILNSFDIPAGSGPSVDPDAQAFITAAAITDPTQQSAVNQLVLDLKTANIWTKMKAVYPFVGGTATSHKYNLKDPRDLDAAFRLVFNGGWTHSSTGALPNGTNAYANTHINVLSHMQLSNMHISGYSRTDSNGLLAFIAGNHNGSNRLIIWPRTSGSYIGSVNSNLASGIANGNSLGMYIANRVSSAGTRHSIKGTLYSQTIAEAATLPNVFIHIAKPGDINSYYDNRERCFHSVGFGLTDQEMIDLHNIVSAVQSMLNRAV